MQEKKKFSFGQLILTITVGIFVLTMIAPLVWMLSTSFKNEIDVFKFPIEWIPRTWNFQNYIKVWTGKYNFALYYMNTIKITVIVTVVQLLISAMGAYAFAKLKFKWNNVLFTLFLATMMIPEQVMLVPKFMMLKWLGLLDTHAGLILILAFSVYGVFLLKQSMMSIPDSILEAAKIDGAGHWRIFSQIMLPMSVPTLTTLAILRFVWTWNDYQNSLIFLNSKKLYTLQQGMSQFATETGTMYALLMAASVCAIVPLFIVYLFGQKYIIDGVGSGAVKG